MSYIGSTPTTQSFIAGTDYFNGNGSTTAFTLSRPVVSVNDIQAVVNNVVQVPNDAYNVSGNTITFTSAPSSGTGNVYVRYLSTTTQSITPSQNTVSYSTWNSNLQNQTFAFKNRIINGDMTIDQRNNGASVTANTTNTVFSVDRWKLYATQNNRYTAQQNAGSVTPPAGFTNYLGITSSSAYSITNADYFDVVHQIEGFNVADLGWGTVNAQTVTLSFWVRSSLTGTFGGGFTNSSYARSYPFSYTINAANTWEYKTITVAGDTTGTWLTNQNRGIEISFGLGNGSDNSATAGSWTSGWKPSSTGAVSVVGTNGATFYITGVQLEKGTAATSYDYLPYSTELQLCQRYYQVFYPAAQELIYNEDNGAPSKFWQLYLPVPMRATPTATYSSGMTGGTVVGLPGTVSSLSLTSASVNRVSTRVTMSTGGGSANLVYHCDSFANDSVGLSSEL